MDQAFVERTGHGRHRRGLAVRTNQVAAKVTCIATTLATYRGGRRRSAPEPGERAKWQ